VTTIDRLAIVHSVILIALVPLRNIWLASTLKRMRTWSKLPHSG